MPDQPIITRADLEAIYKSLLAKEAAERDEALACANRVMEDWSTHHAGKAQAYEDAAWLVSLYLEGKVRTQEANRDA